MGGDAPVEAFFGDPATGGRVFYVDDTLSRLNVDRRTLPLSERLGLLPESRQAAKPPSFCAGTVRLPQVAPGFRRNHSVPFPSAASEPLVSPWIGFHTGRRRHRPRRARVITLRARPTARSRAPEHARWTPRTTPPSS
jgi:hypothetical protein